MGQVIHMLRMMTYTMRFLMYYSTGYPLHALDIPYNQGFDNTILCSPCKLQYDEYHHPLQSIFLTISLHQQDGDDGKHVRNDIQFSLGDEFEPTPLQQDFS